MLNLKRKLENVETLITMHGRNIEDVGFIQGKFQWPSLAHSNKNSSFYATLRSVLRFFAYDTHLTKIRPLFPMTTYRLKHIIEQLTISSYVPHGIIILVTKMLGLSIRKYGLIYEFINLKMCSDDKIPPVTRLWNNESLEYNIIWKTKKSQQFVLKICSQAMFLLNIPSVIQCMILNEYLALPFCLPIFDRYRFKALMLIKQIDCMVKI